MGAVTATVLGTFKSIARAVPVSSATGSLDAVTLTHGLGACPHLVSVTLRSIVTITSTGTPALAVRSWDASIVTLDQALVNNAPTNAQYDVVCERTHSLVR